MVGTGATPRQHLRHRLQTRAALFALFGAPVLFIVGFALRYGYQPIVVAMHLAIVLLTSLVTVTVMRRRGPVTIAVIGASVTTLYWLVTILSTVTNEAWGWSISLNLARAYIPYVPEIVGNLPVHPALAPSLLLAGALLAVSIWVVWWRMAPRVAHRLRSGSSHLGSISAAAVALVAFIAWGRRDAFAASEPFVALVSASGTVGTDSARARNVAARRAYDAPAIANPRNVIVIFSDALRADHMGIYGYARPTTPFLSRLDSAGRVRKVKLAMATCPFTACGVISTLASRDSAVLELGSLKIQDVLHDRGYRTWFIDSSDHTVWYALRLHYGDNVDYFFDGWSTKRYSLKDDRLVLEGLSGVPAYTGTPGFFSLFLTSTHLVGTKLPEFRRWTPATGMNAYDNGILQADNSISKIFDTLDTKGYLAGSLVVILGDHGDAFGEHGIIGHTLSVYQETLHVPMLIIDPDTSVHYANLEYATQSDVAPTILERLGLPKPREWQVVSSPPKQFSTHWTDRARPRHAVVYREQGRIWKYMYMRRWGQLVEELYELGADPNETSNLIEAPGLDPVRAVVRRRAAARW
jgi:glucan phosphoethanolaminetransferase (alkaline phosphatase superfamily)